MSKRRGYSHALGVNMEYFEEYTEEVTRKRLVKTECDKCGAVIPVPDTGVKRVFRLECYTETRSRDDAFQTGWEVGDLCDKCVEWLLHTLIAANTRTTSFIYKDTW